MNRPDRIFIGLEKLKRAPMVTLFLIIIVAFFICTIAFVYANDFAKETLEILLPSIGAILLSFFIGFKQIYLDKVEEDIYEVPIAVLYNSSTGEFTSMASDHVSLYSESFLKLKNGVGQIDKMPNNFETYDFIDEITKEDGDEGGGDLTELHKHIVQYSFWKWLRWNHTYGKIARGEDYVIGANIFSKSSTSTPGEKIKKLKLKRIDLKAEKNPFLKERVLDLELSRDFEINSDEGEYSISLKSETSCFTVFHDNYFREHLESSPFVDKLLSLNGCDYNENYILAIQRVKFKFEQDWFSVFSDQAKYERQWHSQVKKEIYEAFSWKALRKVYEDYD